MKVIERMPFERYVELPGEHATALKDLLVSPRLYHRKQQQARTDKDALRIGRAAHTAILEPDRFLLEYTVWRLDPEGNTRRRYGKIWDEFREVNADKTILTETQYMMALAMRDAARSHPLASQLLTEKGRNELTIQWIDERTGLSCKARFDRLCSALVDVKTTRDPSPHRFSGDAAKFGYPLQLAFYQEAARAVGLGDFPVKIVAVQSVEPYDVVVYDLAPEIIAHGRDQFKLALDRLIECRQNDAWPGIAHNEEMSLTLPAWATPDFDEEALTFDGAAIF
jgi:hypothetical protein